MTLAFKGPSGRCTALARGAVRLGFHDAAAWEKTLSYGGADGSMILTDEVSRAENAGLQEIVNQMRNWFVYYLTNLTPQANHCQVQQVQTFWCLCCRPCSVWSHPCCCDLSTWTKNQDICWSPRFDKTSTKQPATRRQRRR
jgi:Peroxidase